MKKDYLYSIIIPVYNSEKLITNTVESILEVQKRSSFNTEIVLVEDGSPDLSWQKVKQLTMLYDNVRAIRLTKNYGQHTAVFCGLQHCTGDFIITMDDDGQNPAEEIHKLIEKIHEGYDAVFGKFPQKKHALYRRLGTKLVRSLNNSIFGLPNDLVLSNFRIMTKETVKNMLKHKTNYPYIPGLILLSGSSFCNVETLHKKRTIGHSNYSIRKIFNLMSRLLVNYSSFPLRILGYIGIVFTVIPLAIAAYAILNAIIKGSEVKGWTSLMVVLSLYNAILVLMVSVIGIYLSRLMKQNSQPAYLIREEL